MAAGELLQDAEGAIDRVTLSPWVIVVPLAALCLLGMVGFTAVRAAGRPDACPGGRRG